MSLISAIDFHAYSAQVNAIQRRAVADKLAIISKNPGWSRDRDARIWCFAKLIDSYNGAYLSLTWLTLLASGQHHGFSAMAPDGDPATIDWPHLLKRYSAFVKFGLVHTQFLSIESSFRNFVSGIDSAACSRGCAEFQSIAAWLFKRLDGDFSEEAELLELLREIRNVIHTNGVYLPRNANIRAGGGREITHRGVTHKFVVGSMAPVGDWPRLLDIVDDCRAMMARVVNDPVLLGVVGEITDWTGAGVPRQIPPIVGVRR